MVQRSEEFNDAYWTKTNSSIVNNVIVAPNGTLTGDKLIEDTLFGDHAVQRNLGNLTGTYTWSVYAKADERKWLAINAYGGSSRRTYFNLENGTIGVNQNTSASIVSVGNGWYKCSATGTAANPTIFIISPALDNLVTFYQGNGYSGIYVWGAQFEAASFSTSYIPTVASQVTRSADAASMTGANFTSWYRADEGTLYADINPQALATTSGISINDNTTSNRIRLATTSVSDQGTITTSGTDQAVLDGGTPVANTNMRLALGYKVNDFGLSLNASTTSTDTVGTVPVVNQLQIGAETTSRGNLTLKKVAYYPAKLTSAQLQAITT